MFSAASARSRAASPSRSNAARLVERAALPCLREPEIERVGAGLDHAARIQPDQHRRRRRCRTAICISTLWPRFCSSATTSAGSALVQQQPAGIHGMVVEARHQVLGSGSAASSTACSAFIAEHRWHREAPAAATGPGCRRPAWRASISVLSGPDDEGRAERHARPLARRQLVRDGREPAESSAPARVSGMPVSPAITGGIHAPEGVIEIATPSLSMASTQVVSLASSAGSSLVVRRSAQ